MMQLASTKLANISHDNICKTLPANETRDTTTHQFVQKVQIQSSNLYVLQIQS